MAPRKKTGMKEFYGQKKKTNTEKTKKSQVRTPGTKRQVDTIPTTYNEARASSGTLGSSAVQPTTLVAYGRKDCTGDTEEVEEVLRQFDMNMTYGPCLGVPRLERWERANKLGLNPPKQVKDLMENAHATPDCLWEGRV
uniref:DNA polymerase delta subunit 4 n=1 Tax=Araucaria cunninghamii TaxID=56994 RepID=A0A0D6R7J2_ARACU